MEVGLRPGDFVFDGDAAIPEKGHTPPNFWPMSIVAKNGGMDQDAMHLVRR